MNYFYRILFLVLFTISLSAQNPIPNFGFEDWTGGLPDNWTANNIPPSAIPVTQFSDSHSGSSALKGEVVDLLSNPWAPTVLTNTALGPYFAVSHNYAQLTGYYKLNSLNNDNLVVTAYLFDTNFTMVAIAFDTVITPTATYMQFSIPFDYSISSGNDAVHCRIEFFISNNSGDPTVGSYMLVDDFELSGTASAIERNEEIRVPGSFKLNQNYPNPFNPSTMIKYELSKTEKVNIEVFNLSGQRIKTLLNKQMPAGSYKVEFTARDLPSGVYLYRIEAGGFQEAKKMVLLR